MASYGGRRVRSTLAPAWRKSVRSTVILIGLAVFLIAELAIARWILDGKWHYTVVLLFFCVAVPLAAARPAIFFAIWLVLSPWVFRIVSPVGFGGGMALGFDNVSLGLVGLVLALRALRDRQPLRLALASERMFILLGIYLWLRPLFLTDAGFLPYVAGLFDLIVNPLVVYFVAKGTMQTEKQIRWLLGALVVAGLVWTVSAFYEHFTGKMLYSLLFGVDIGLTRQDVGAGRAAGASRGAVTIGTVLAAALFAAAHLRSYTQNAKIRAFYYVLMPTLLLALFWSYTRGVYISFVFALIVVLLMAQRARRVYAAIVVALVVVGFAAAPQIMANREFESRMTNPANYYGRIAMNRAAIEMIKHNFWFGVGNVQDAVNDYVVDPIHHPGGDRRPGAVLRQRGVPDNEYLFVFAQGGIIAFVLEIGAELLFLVYLFGKRKTLPKEGLLGQDLMAMIIAYSCMVFVAGLSVQFQSEVYGRYLLVILFAMGVRIVDVAARNRKEGFQDPAAPVKVHALQ